MLGIQSFLSHLGMLLPAEEEGGFNVLDQSDFRGGQDTQSR